MGSSATDTQRAATAASFLERQRGDVAGLPSTERLCSAGDLRGAGGQDHLVIDIAIALAPEHDRALVEC